MDELELPIPYDKILFFYYESPGGNIPAESREERLSILEATDKDECEWNALSRDGQDLLISEALKEWLSDRINYGWDVE